MIVSTTIEAGVAELEIEAEVRPGHRSVGFDDPGAGPELNWVRTYRIENGLRVELPVALVEQVLGAKAWDAIEVSLFETAADRDDDGPDPDDARDDR